MIKKPIINANLLDARQDKDAIEVIKKPPCFFAYRDKASVLFRKLDENGVVDSSLRAKRVPLANFLANFLSFDDIKIKEDFKKDVFFFIGKSGLRKDHAVTMKFDFYVNDSDTGDVLKYQKGDVLITTESGLNLAMTMNQFLNQYITEDKLHLFTKPEVTFVKSNNENAMSM